ILGRDPANLILEKTKLLLGFEMVLRVQGKRLLDTLERFEDKLVRDLVGHRVILSQGEYSLPLVTRQSPPSPAPRGTTRPRLPLPIPSKYPPPRCGKARRRRGT